MDTTEKLLSSIPLSTLMKASTKLSARYRKGERVFLQNREDYLAYLVARFPATLGVLRSVLKKAPGKMHSLLDLGAGPGTTYLAAKELFPELFETLLFEQDPEMVKLGKQIIEDDVQWRNESLTENSNLPEADLVVFSYSLGEIPKQEKLLEEAWRKTRKILCLIEPGTPRGFSTIRKARDQLISLGGQMVAPCPHCLECPMISPDWCHFSERIQRSSLHRKTKGAELGYEDEKYSYVIFSKEEAQPVCARILRHPQKGSGHIQFSLCTRDGLKKRTISRKEGERYKQAKKLKWGDSLCLEDQS